MRILRAGSADLDKIAPLFDLYRQFYKQTSDLVAAHDFLRDRLAKDESVIFFAEESGHGLGFVQLYPSFSSVSLKRLWILNDLFVAQEGRRRSIGHGLMERAADFARETGARGLTLKTAADNKPAQNLYESLGWRRNELFISYDLTMPG